MDTPTSSNEVACNTKMALQMTNSMVEGTGVEEKVHKGKKKHLKESKNDEDGGAPLLSHKYGLNFMK